MHRRALLLALSLISGAIVQAAVARVPLNIFTDLGLTPQQIAAIDAGRPVAKVLPWGGPSEVYVFGAVHVDGSPETYLEAARDVGRLSGTPGYQGIGEIRDDATVADLSALAFDPDDVKALKNCREGSCDVQLPTTGIQTVSRRRGLVAARCGGSGQRPRPSGGAAAGAGVSSVAATRRSATIGTSSIPRVSPISSRR